MHDAALVESKDAVNALIRLPGIRDEPGEDGLTGFAIALGLMNANLSQSILMSNVEPREHIIFLAEQVLDVNPDGDSRIVQLQKTIRKTIGMMKIQHEPEPKYLPQRYTRYVDGQLLFPMVNGEIEEEERYYKNKNWQRKNLRDNLDSSIFNNEITPDLLEPLILDKFCIESKTDVRWEIKDVKIASCTHEGERYKQRERVCSIYLLFKVFTFTGNMTVLSLKT